MMSGEGMAFLKFTSIYLICTCNNVLFITQERKYCSCRTFKIARWWRVIRFKCLDYVQLGCGIQADLYRHRV